jgi:membrane protease YdiL (CAAX protease family)
MSDTQIVFPQEPINQAEGVKKTDVLLGLLLTLVPLIILGLLGEWLGDWTTSGAVLIYISYVLCLVIATAVLKRRSSGWQKIGLGKPNSWPKTILLAVGTVIAYIIIFNFILPALLQLLPLPTIAPADKSNQNVLFQNLPLLIMSLIAAWTIIAFGEEMLFRAFLMDSLALIFENSRAKWMLSLIGSSLLFGLAHFSWGVAGVIETTIMGLLLGTVFLLTDRNLWVTIIAHALLNSMVFLLLYSGVI